MSANKIEILNTIIQNRQSVFPKSYIQKEISKGIITQVLENAIRAPTHKLTEPWFFRVLRNEAKMDLANFMAKTYKSTIPENQFLEKKYKSFEKKMNASDCLIVISMIRDEAKRIPEWEEIAAVSCAVQNMQLTCEAYKIGCYWSSPKLISTFGDHFKFTEAEKCLGLFYMGYYKERGQKTKRIELSDKLIWMD